MLLKMLCGGGGASPMSVRDMGDDGDETSKGVRERREIGFQFNKA
jgi:hypothetical protein